MRDGCYHVKWVQLGIDKAMLANKQIAVYSSPSAEGQDGKARSELVVG